MADVAFQLVHDSVRIKVVKWSLTTANPTGVPYILGGRYPDKSFQAVGNFGTGGHVKPEGTNEIVPVNWAILTDPAGAPIDLSAAGMAQIMENAYQFRPHVTAGIGVAVDVYLCIRG